MDFCPECGSMILNGKKCPTCGYYIDGFNLNNLKICIPENFILDKAQFKNNFEGILSLILNKNQVNFTKDDILDNYSEIVDIANNNYINSEKSIILKDFSRELNSYTKFIDDEKRLALKSKFNRDYFSYYDDLNFDSKIDELNKKFIEKCKNKIYFEFRNDLKSHDGIFTRDDIKKFKLKYTKSYFDFFTFFSMENEIKKRNVFFRRKKVNEAFKILRTKYQFSDSEISNEILLKLKEEHPDIEWDEIIENYNSQFHKEKLMSHKTTDNVYYLYDYIRKDDWKYSASDKVRISKQILKYKDGRKNSLIKFTRDLLILIEKFIEHELSDDVERIFLVSIPSSTKSRDNNSSIKKSIRIILEKYEKGLLNFNNVQLIDLSDLLYRKVDVTASHIERQSYEVHMKTIGFNKNKLNNIDKSVFLLLDDITTTGNILNACTDILIKNGINGEKIYKMVLAVTGD